MGETWEFVCKVNTRNFTHNNCNVSQVWRTLHKKEFSLVLNTIAGLFAVDHRDITQASRKLWRKHFTSHRKLLLDALGS